MCENYVHYSHRCPRLEYFHDTPQALREVEVAPSDSTSPLPTGFSPTPMQEQEVSQPPIMIHPPDVEMTDCTTPIL